MSIGTRELAVSTVMAALVAVATMFI